MDPDLFITIVFVSFVVALAFAGLVVARGERRRDDAGSREGAHGSAAADGTAPVSASAARDLERTA
jgi:hypothetical protein